MRGHLGKYIATQHLRRFQYPEWDALSVFDYIDALGEHPHAKRKLEYAGPAIPGEDELWQLVSNRNQFLADQTIRRLCVTVEGGVGKTKLLEELEATVAYDHPYQVVLRLDLRNLPTQADDFLDSGPQLLARRAWNELKSLRKQFTVHGLQFPELGSPDESDVIPEEILSMVQRAGRTGDLCLIVDALDQLDKQAASERIRALNDFISSKYCPKIRCIIAGRPYAIKRIWDALQLGELRSQDILEDERRVRIQQPVWEFCKLQKFDADQVKEYLSGVSAQYGAEKLAALKRMDAEEIHLPRTLNIIRQLTAGQLREMQTAADLYWHAMNQTIIDNFRLARTDFQLQHLRVEHVRPIVAAVAFAMMLWKEQPVVEVPSIRTDKARDFFRFMKQAGFIDVLAAEGIDFELALLDLAQVDSESLQFHFYSESPTREAPSEVRDIRMSDATVRDFFAAHWVARYLSPQLDFLEAQQQPEVDLEALLHKSFNTFDFKKFWQLLIGMPNKGLVSDDEAATESSWTAAVATLFTVRDERPCELMYRCWPELLWRAGFMENRDHVDGPNWNETLMAAGTLKAQREVRKHFETGKSDDAASPAKHLVTLFLTDYLEQCKTQEVACMSDANVTPEMRLQFYLDCVFLPIDIKSIPLRSKEYESERKKRLAYLNEHYPLWLLERSFRVIEGGPFLYGDKPDPMQPAHVETFVINAYLLSEAMYACFDQWQEAAGKSLRARNKLSWFRSQMFAVWCHGRLPTEHQWEAAARGKVGKLALKKHWSYGFKWKRKNALDLQQAYTDTERFFSVYDRPEPSEVAQRFPTTKAELYDIHGQLYEWLGHKYWSGDPAFVSVYGVYTGVLCGGRYYDLFFESRCSNRYYRPQNEEGNGHGCRVCRACNP